jgi:hypothetical protein
LSSQFFDISVSETFAADDFAFSGVVFSIEVGEDFELLGGYA